MRVDNHLPEDLVASVTPRSVIMYAKAHGWERMPTRSRTGPLLLFRRTDQPDSHQQLIVPMEPSYDDFSRRMADAVIKLAEVEKQPAHQTLNDLLQADADLVRFSIRSRATKHGRLPLEQAVQALNGVRQSLLSAAHSVILPQRHHPRLGRTEAKEFLDQCSLEQTERGSYTVAVSCPISDAHGYYRQFTGESPFGRQTTTLLMRSTAALVNAIESDQLDSLLDPGQDVTYSPSANLCDALLRIQPEEPDASLALSASWSSVLPPPQDLTERAPVLIRAEHRSVIQDVYYALLPREADAPTTLFLGHVDTMNGNVDADGRVSGEIAVSILDEDMKVHLELDADDYSRALTAHAKYAVVKFRGRLIRGTRKHRINDVREFELVE